MDKMDTIKTAITKTARQAGYGRRMGRPVRIIIGADYCLDGDTITDACGGLLVTTEGDGTYHRLARLIMAQLRWLGFDVKIDNYNPYPIMAVQL